MRPVLSGIPEYPLGAATIAAMKVVLYSRPGCHLCDVARRVIAAEQPRAGFDLAEIDISGDDALELEYGIRIPVVEIDGVEAFEIQVDPARFAALVRPPAQSL
jgi:glutaredoxin